MGMGLKGRIAVVLAINVVICAVGLLHPTEPRLHLPDGHFLNGASHFFDCSDRGRPSAAKEFWHSPQKSNCTLGLTLFLQCRLEIEDRLIPVTQPGCIEGLIAFESRLLLCGDPGNNCLPV
jgi:hypothetical protein